MSNSPNFKCESADERDLSRAHQDIMDRDGEKLRVQETVPETAKRHLTLLEYTRALRLLPDVNTPEWEPAHKALLASYGYSSLQQLFGGL